jgi:hypothetical protein
MTKTTEKVTAMLKLIPCGIALAPGPELWKWRLDVPKPLGRFILEPCGTFHGAQRYETKEDAEEGARLAAGWLGVEVVN